MAGVASGVGINMAVVGLGAAGGGQQIGFIGNDRFCGRCFGQVGNTPAGMPQPTFIVCASGVPPAPGVNNLQSICSELNLFTNVMLSCSMMKEQNTVSHFISFVLFINI